MQKKRKIFISVAVCMGLALAATQISINGGLQSSTIAGTLHSCKNSSITSLERCREPLTAEKTRIQKEITVLDKKIAAKKTECIKLIGVPNRSTQLTTCRAQLKVLERDKTKQEANMKPIDVAISKLVSEAPLQAKMLSAQKEVDTVKAQIVTKTAECNTLRTQKKTAQFTLCSQQMATLKQTQTTKQTALITATNALKKVAGVATATVAPAPTQHVTPTQTNTTPTTTPAPTQPTTVPVLVPAPTQPTIPVTPTQPTIPNIPTTTILHCCADSKAKNFNSSCGVTANTNPNSALCVYPVNPGCTDSTAVNYVASADGDDGSCIPSTPLCMNSLAPNYMQPAPCQEPQENKGCTDPRANNRDPSAVVDDGSCTYDPIPACDGEGDHGFDVATNKCATCSDKIQNGNETDVDCGGKCGECALGCKDPKANNYNGDPKVKDGGPGACTYDEESLNTITYVCDDPDALNFDPNALGEPANHACQYNPICDDDTALNFVPPKERKKGDKGNKDVCTYCDPTKIQRYNLDIVNSRGAKVKTEIQGMAENERECLKKEICKNTNIQTSTCTISTEYKTQYANLQLYLALSKAFSGTLDGVYRIGGGRGEILYTPTAGSTTRTSFVNYLGTVDKLSEIKNKCPFIRDLLSKELIKDYEPESTERIKVTQMALTMLGQYSGTIDGNKDKTYNLLQKYYKWDSKKFGYSYIAGADRKWQVGRATEFGYKENPKSDNGRGTPFMDPAGEGIITNNTTLQGASLPLPVTVYMLCPNIVKEINNYLLKLRTQGKTDVYCTHMINSPDPMNPLGGLYVPATKYTEAKTYSGLGVLNVCITNANAAGLTTCRDKHHRAKVKVSSMGKTILLPLVDIGPSESVWNDIQYEPTIDLTRGAMTALGGGGGKMLYETCFELIP